MPELPEVETLVRQLSRVIVDRRIDAAALSHDNVLSGVTAERLLTELPGRRIAAVTRRAKHALVHTDSAILGVQPGMTGSLIHYTAPLTADEQRYAVLTCTLDDGTALVYRDIRRIGTLRWMLPDEWHIYAARLGPEPLDPAFTADELIRRLRRSKAAVKKAIMDQKVVVGVGNIYANEALFLAGIDPSMPAADVPGEKLVALHRHIQETLTEAIASEGTSFRDYVTSTGDKGGFQQKLLVYGRAGQPCRVCGTTLASTHDIDARQTVFCWRCQG
jgi:formamidopyrimidine-DNA glycosylase